MKTKNPLRKIVLLWLATSLFLSFLFASSRGQIMNNSSGASETLATIVFFREDEEGKFVVENLDVSLIDGISLPLNNSMPAFNDHFRSARFSVVSGQGVPDFWVFLRVSYDDILTVGEAESYANDVLGELRSAFNLIMNISNQTYNLNNRTSSVDIYYRLSDVGNMIQPFNELIKYVPSDGFGQLVSSDLLSFYLRNDSIPNTHVHQSDIFSLEYTLNRTDQGFIWSFLLSLSHQVKVNNADQIEVSLNELLNHTNQITPSNMKTSMASVEIDENGLSFRDSSPACSSMKEESNMLTLIYNITEPHDNIVIRIGIKSDVAFNLVYIALAGVAIAIISIAVLISMRNRHKSTKAELRKS